MYNMLSNYGVILVSIYLSDYSIANLHGPIQECHIFCAKNKASRLLFLWALE